MENKGNDLLVGLLIGGVVGLLVGILYAPKSGRETREELSKGAEDLLAKAKEEYRHALEKSRAAYEEAVRRIKDLDLVAKVEEVDNKIKDISERSAEAIHEGAGRLKRAVEAGVQAFKEGDASEEKG